MADVLKGLDERRNAVGDPVPTAPQGIYRGHCVEARKSMYLKSEQFY